MGSKIDQFAAEWVKSRYWDEASVGAKIINRDRELGMQDYTEGAKRLLQLADQLAAKPSAYSSTQWEPFVHIKDLKALFGGG